MVHLPVISVNKRWRWGARLTGSDGVTYDVDDDTGDADVGHPRNAVLSTHTQQSLSNETFPQQKRI